MLASRRIGFRLSAIRHHSHSSYGFAPSGSTSADTEIPYGDPNHPCHVYLPQHPSMDPPKVELGATTDTPKLSSKEREILEKIIRVDQAGELGANYIYAGQHAVIKMRSSKRNTQLIQDMWDGEKKHIAAFDKVVTQHQVRPTALYPAWKVAGFAVGALTAALGTRSAMACTEAVETVIGEHYNSQLETLSDPQQFSSTHPSINLLRNVLKEFRDDELEHLDTAVKNQSQQAPAHALLSAIIAGGCRAAIAFTEKI